MNVPGKTPGRLRPKGIAAKTLEKASTLLFLADKLHLDFLPDVLTDMSEKRILVVDVYHVTVRTSISLGVVCCGRIPYDILPERPAGLVRILLEALHEEKHVIPLHRLINLETNPIRPTGSRSVFGIEDLAVPTGVVGPFPGRKPILIPPQFHHFRLEVLNLLDSPKHPIPGFRPEILFALRIIWVLFSMVLVRHHEYCLWI